MPEQEDFHLSRRDFLILTGIASAAIAGRSILSGLGLNNLDPDSGTVENKFQPRNVGGIEIYGLDEPMNSDTDILALYAMMDIQFAAKHDITIKNKTEQRKEFLDENTRYLEIVVRKSAYDSFSKKKLVTGVTFPKWIQAHMDLSNRCMENAKPQSSLCGEVRRIVVIDDALASALWDEKSYREGKGEPFDDAWRRKFGGNFSIDIDTSWAVADDYRGDYTYQNIWTVKHTNRKTVVTKTRTANNTQESQEFVFPQKDDTLNRLNGIQLDMTLIHEWSHHLFSLPDEYTFDVYDFGRHTFARHLWSTGSFAIPYFDPYLSFLSYRNIMEKRRTMGQKEFHESAKQTVVTMGHGVSNPRNTIEIRRVKLLDNSIYKKKEFPKDPDQLVPGDSVRFSRDFLRGEGNSWLLTKVENGNRRDIFFPAACFNIPGIIGSESAQMEIILEKNIPDRKYATQEIVPIDQSEKSQFMKSIKAKGWVPYATMEVPGTTTMFLWYLTNRIDTFYG